MPAPSPAIQNLYPQTGSSLTDNKTYVSLSTFVIIKVNNTSIGALQSIDITESRDIRMIDEVSTDGHIDSCPVKSSTITGHCERIRFDRLRITEAFSRGFLHIKSQRVPFDIHIIDTMAGDENSGMAVVTVIQNVWFKSLSYGYKANDWVISDRADFEAEGIYSYMASPGKSAAQQGTRQMANVDWDVYEVAADVGFRKGAPDLINAPQAS